MTEPGTDAATPSAWNLPNAITVFRTLFAPVCLVLLIVDDREFGPLRYAAAALFVIGMATDGIDGHIARSRGLVTDFGKIADPIADKALTGFALVGLSVIGELPWWVTILILVREWGITIMRLWVLSDRVVIAASWAGKIKTIVQAVAIACALTPLWVWWGNWVHVGNAVLMSLALILTLWSGATYVVALWRQRHGAQAAGRGRSPDGD